MAESSSSRELGPIGHVGGFAEEYACTDFFNGRRGLAGVGLGLDVIVTSSQSVSIAVSSSSVDVKSR